MTTKLPSTSTSTHNPHCELCDEREHQMAVTAVPTFADRFSIDQRLCAFRANGFTVRLWYVGITVDGRQALAYQVRRGGKTVYEGEDFQASAYTNCDAVKEQLELCASVLSFLCHERDSHAVRGGMDDDTYDAAVYAANLLQERAERTSPNAR